MDLARVFIGFDAVEAITWSVFAHSIQRRASRPVLIAPVMLSQLDNILTRPRDALQSNDFSFSRWLVPYLCNYEGWAIFADCDMLCRSDIYELWNMRDEQYAVQVVQHDHKPAEREKYLGNIQTKYERKNWSSVMLMNCAKCRLLTPQYVNTAHGLALHQFRWLSDCEIGALSKEWNHLEGYNTQNASAKIVHYTHKGPYFHEYRGAEFADEWFAERDLMTYCRQQ